MSHMNHCQTRVPPDKLAPSWREFIIVQSNPPLKTVETSSAFSREGLRSQGWRLWPDAEPSQP